MKLSAFVIAKNEEKNLRECLESLRFVDEIIVVDSGSSDSTLAIARQYTDKVFTRPFDDFSSQKNFALSKTGGEWALSVDADERVTPGLKDEILKRVADSKKEAAYRIPRQTYFLGKRFRFSGMQSDKPVRLFRKNSGKFIQPIHEYFFTDGPTGELQNKLLHHTTASIEKELAKTEFYTDLEARFMKDRKMILSGPAARLKAAAVFGYHYFFKMGFLDGAAGFLFAWYSGRYTFRKYEKLRQAALQERLEPEIEKSFDRHAPKLPDRIDRSDRRLAALLNVCGDVRGKKVLDVGCGKGRFAEVFSDLGAQVTGIDPSEELLKEARKQKGIFLQASVTALPFEDESFDVAYAVEVIEHLPFLQASLQEMARVLKKGGVLVLIDRNKYSMNQKRFLAPNVLIKRWHEWKNEWIYPDNFPFREKWFSRRQLLTMMAPSFENLSGHHVLSDGEKNCGWHFLFEKIPGLRLFILWRGVRK